MRILTIFLILSLFTSQGYTHVDCSTIQECLDFKDQVEARLASVAGEMVQLKSPVRRASLEDATSACESVNGRLPNIRELAEFMTRYGFRIKPASSDFDCPDQTRIMGYGNASGQLIGSFCYSDNDFDSQTFFKNEGQTLWSNSRVISIIKVGSQTMQVPNDNVLNFNKFGKTSRPHHSKIETQKIRCIVD